MDRDLFVAWGELLWDLYPDSKRLGGAPSNVAVHLAALGMPVSLISRVGRDELGEQALQALQERGVCRQGVQIDNEQPTGRVGIEIVDAEARYTLHPGAWRQIACDDAAKQTLARCRGICFGTLSQESAAGRASFAEAIAALPREVVRLCDPNLRGGRIDAELTRQLLGHATVVKVNEGELAVLASTYGQPDPIRWMLEELGVHMVAETLGDRGSCLHTREQNVRVDAFAAGVDGDNVGAGDSYCAVLLAGVCHGTSLQHLATAANRYAAFVASRRGATPVPPAALVEEIRAELGLV